MRMFLHMSIFLLNVLRYAIMLNRIASNRIESLRIKNAIPIRRKSDAHPRKGAFKKKSTEKISRNGYLQMDGRTDERTDERTKISTSRAPVGAKNETYVEMLRITHLVKKG